MTSGVLSRLAAIVLLAAAMLPAAPAAADEVTAYLFWQEGCPYCQRAKTALHEIAESDADLRLVEVELGASRDNDAFFAAVVAQFAIEPAAVPLFVAGRHMVLGFSSAGDTADHYRRVIDDCRAGGCGDIRAMLAPDGEPPPAEEGGVTLAAEPPQTLTLPFVGEIRPGDLSLPLLTVVLAAVDGFNPCAMWVLAILIGFLLGVDDRRRMWTLGVVFLAATGAMYFAVMAAWLNVVLWIGAVSLLRIAIGALAIAAGIFYLREYWTNPEGVCRVTGQTRRRTVTERFRALVEEPSLLVASLGIAALAIAVNLIELVCSAGVPAVYTQALAMHDMPRAAHYGYLLLYLAVFLLDDMAIFVVAMLTLRAVASTGRYARISHLIGGIVLLALGAIMVLRPDLLA